MRLPPQARLSFFLLVVCSFASSSSIAQPAMSDMVALRKQCKAALSAAQCQQVLPACQRFAMGIQGEPPSPQLDKVNQTLVDKIGWCESSLGQFAEAELHLRQGLAISQRLYGSQHTEIVASLNNLAFALHGQGKDIEAEQLYRASLAMRIGLQGAEHPDAEQGMLNLARMFYDQGRYLEAEHLYHHVVNLRRKRLSAEHLDVAVAMYHLASALQSQSRALEAEPLYREVIAIQKKLRGGEHIDIAQNMGNLAATLHTQGKYAEAERLGKDALAMKRRLLGEEHPDIATNLGNLALMMHAQGKRAEAEMLARQALTMRSKLIGPRHPDFVKSLDGLVMILGGQGKYAEAEQLARDSLAIRQQIYGEEHAAVAGSINNLASILQRRGDFAQAAPLFFRALTMQRKLLGEEHPEVINTLINISSMFLAQGQPAAAIPPYRNAARLREAQVRSIVSETRMEAFLQSLRAEEEALYGLIPVVTTDASLAKLALTQTLLRKGRAAEAGAIANRLTHRHLTDPELQKRFVAWQSLRQQREALLYGGPKTLTNDQYRARLNELKIEAESSEAQLSVTLPEIRRLRSPSFDTIVRDVASRLPANGALIEVVWSRSYREQVSGTESRFGAPHYIALLLFADQRIVSVDLGTAAQIGAAGRTLLATLENPSSDPQAAAQALYQQVMQPLLAQLAGATELFLSLDGTLSLVPFDALHDGTDYLLGRFRMHYLTIGRDLLRDPTQLAAQPPLLIANPDFGAPDEKATGPAHSLYQRLAGLPRLPGTGREAELLAPILGVTPLVDRHARESVVHAAHAPRILYIATHGLFLSNQDLPAPSDLDSGQAIPSFGAGVRSRNVAALEAEVLPGEAGAMNRSALTLAGVLQGHHARDTSQDGLLTAEEARSLDLEGTQLVVLSACQTGQGALSAGQGIYGMRRAFLVAGAETLITSLWRIHDDATGELMGTYYRKLLASGTPGDRLGAMIDAMKELRQRPGRSHPYFWAPSLVIGMDGPLRFGAQVIRMRG